MLKVTVIGTIASDFELRGKDGENTPYTFIRIASTRRYRDKEGNRLSDFVSVKMRGGLAELCAEYLGKGDKVAITGELETITSTDENGNARQTGFIIKGNDVQFLSTKAETAEE